ncbi:hypothetical protein DBR32_07600 [Taibaiella sp. KBW10]|uniref:energy transducer TonB n=1 Tax=Taibaiella sp. KBW10 TaxID=2153357 RepID=UPI000F9E17DF|nr:energy transducer TonB [Taibaiella sp. KBW10]RQO31798.1 hypothetical protein DBR32_07600 [Taibaiella sp. KBW10]
MHRIRQYFCIGFISFLSTSGMYAQDVKPKVLPKGIKTLPKFTDGAIVVDQYIKNRIRYPNLARENEVQGRIIVSFLIAKDGTVTSPTIIKGKALGNGIPEEVLRVIRAMPKWVPAKDLKGNPVDFLYTADLHFSIN